MDVFTTLRRSVPRRLATRRIGVPPEQGATIVDALVANGTRHPERTAMRHREASGEWMSTTWGQYLLGVRQVAAGLAELGVAPGERVAILGANRPEWHLADLGAMANGCVTVPLYPTSSGEQIAYLCGHAHVVACFVDSHAQLGRLLEIRDQLPALRHLVVAEGARRAADDAVVGLDELRAAGADRLLADPAAVDARIQQIDPAGVATVVYTSGTTGPPKGTMISHANIMWTLRATTPPYGIGEGDRWLSFLPLSHIAERMMSELAPIGVGGETWFARSLSTLAEDLPACRPTVFLAVPRVWQKLRERVEDALQKQPPAVRAAFARYEALGLRKLADHEDGAGPPQIPGLYETLDRTLGASLRRQIGLDQARVLVAAAAPSHPDLIRWFHAVGLPILDLYGQTEGCGPTTANRIGNVRIGTVGVPFPGMEVRVADDGEVLLRGGNVCLGYLDDPGGTAALLEGGWMHTGDLGALDEDGFLRIVGRKKDLIITAAGKNVSPQGIETDLRNQPLISEAIVIGEGRRYLTALITLDPEELTRWAEAHHRLGDVEALSADPDVLAEVQAAVDVVNARRSHAEHIRRFQVLSRDLTGAAGELTPTMKVKRAVIYDRYRDVIDELYAGT